MTEKIILPIPLADELELTRLAREVLANETEMVSALLAAYRVAERRTETARITELQARAGELLNEARAWRSRFNIYRDALTAMFERAATDDWTNELRPIVERADALEKDAWCGAAALGREFVQAAAFQIDPERRALADKEQHAVLLDTGFIAKWAKRFKKLLDP